MIRQYPVIFLLACFSAAAVAQPAAEEESNPVFKKENLFAGGGVTASIFNNITVLGINPYFGYSVTRWMDAAVSMNFNYISERNYVIDGDKVRQTILAPGAFMRLYPFKFLYAEVQFERNFVHQKYIPAPYSGYAEEKVKYNVNTLLAGIGYASDREEDDDEFFFISLSADLLRKYGSPYTTSNNNIFPILKAGVNIKLFPYHHKKKKH